MDTQHRFGFGPGMFKPGRFSRADWLLCAVIVALVVLLLVARLLLH